MSHALSNNSQFQDFAEFHRVLQKFQSQLQKSQICVNQDVRREGHRMVCISLHTLKLNWLRGAHNSNRLKCNDYTSLFFITPYNSFLCFPVLSNIKSIKDT